MDEIASDTANHRDIGDLPHLVSPPEQIAANPERDLTAQLAIAWPG